MYYIIVNPASKSGKGAKIWSMLEPVLEESKIEYKVFFSKEIGHVIKLVRDLSASILKENSDSVMKLIVLGGDGTLNETIAGMLRAGAETADLPVMMLTAKSSEYDRVVGLDSGADDYMPKPFGMMELVSRVRALLRRAAKPAAEDKLFTAGSLAVDVKRRAVTVDGEPVILTYKEFELLCYLLENRGVVLSRDQILTKIWDYNYSGETRTVDVHIRTLRQKLGDAGALIETVRGVGYRLAQD